MRKFLYLTFFLLAACSTIPKGKCLVNEEKLNKFMKAYAEQQVELEELREWRDNMFF